MDIFKEKGNEAFSEVELFGDHWSKNPYSWREVS